MSGKSLRIALCGISFLLVAATNVSAVERRGFLIGFGIGGGSMSFSESDVLDGGGPAIELHIGGMLGPRTALMFDDFGVGQTFEDTDATLTSAIGSAAVQHWVAPRVWLKAGIGAGGLRVSNGTLSISSDPGFGVMGGVGFEMVQRTKFVLDLQARLSTASISEERVGNFGILLGCNWY